MAERVLTTRAPESTAAAHLARALAGTIREKGGVRLGIPGGAALAALGPARRVLGRGWSRVRLTWVDERCVAFDDPGSNRGLAYRSRALDAAFPPACELPLFSDGERCEEALARVREGLHVQFDDALDVLLLGMGADGHVASLFVRDSMLPNVLVTCVADSPKPPRERISLTHETLATARHAVLLATGRGKREALERLVAGDRDLPASGLHGLTVVTDQHVGGGAP